MGFRITRKAGWGQGWMGFIALALCLAAFCVQVRVGGGRRVPAATRLATLSRPGRVARPHGTSVQSAGQAQAAEDETGRDGHGGTDLAPARAVSLAAPGRPEGPGGYLDPSPAFPSGCAINGGRPRPPPEPSV
jgi:hypothetical protein